MSDEKNVNIDEKLGLLTYKADHSFAHIKIKDASETSPCITKCEEKTCTKVCPARVYTYEEAQKKVLVAYENCIECGACRMLWRNLSVHADGKGEQVWLVAAHEDAAKQARKLAPFATVIVEMRTKPMTGS